MRESFEIDDKLMNDALKATGALTRKEVIELGLKALLQLKMQQGIKDFRGQLHWSGDLDEMRKPS